MGHAPKYYRIYCALKADIISGEYPPGSFLPPEAELAAKYDVSRTTLRHAMALLSEESFVCVQQGRGTLITAPEHVSKDDFVLFHNVTEVSGSFSAEPGAEQNRNINVQGGVIGIIPANREVANALQVEEGARVYRLERLSFINGIPFSYQTNYFSCDKLPGFEQFSGQINKLHDLYQFLEKQYGIQFRSGVENLSAVSASYFDAKLLSVDTGSPLLSFDRTSLFSSDAIEYTTLLMRPDLMKVSISMSGPPTHFR